MAANEVTTNNLFVIAGPRCAREVPDRDSNN